MAYTLKSLLVMLFAGLLFSAPAYANDMNKWELLLDGGFSAPGNVLSDNVRDGFGTNLGAGIVRNLSRTLSVIGAFDYSNFHGRDIPMRNLYPNMNLGTIRKDTAHLFAVSTSAKVKLFSISNRISPYFVNGIGCLRYATQKELLPYYQTAEQTNVVLPDNKSVTKSAETVFMMIWGTGVDIRFKQSIHLFVEGNFALGFTGGSNTHYIPLKMGVRFSLPG